MDALEAALQTEGSGDLQTKLITRFDIKMLTPQYEWPLLHAFYWSAAMGDIHVIQKMINRFRWSPFMKSYRQQTVLTAAIWYDRNDIVESVLSYEYRGDSPEAEKKIESLI